MAEHFDSLALSYLEIDINRNSPFNNMLGLTLTHCSSFLEESLYYFYMAINIKNDFVKSYYNIAYIYDERGKTEEFLKEAIKYYKKAIFFDNETKHSYHGLASCYHRLEQWDLAIENYEKAIKIMISIKVHLKIIY